VHTRLQQLHIQVFHGPFGKPKDVPHLLIRIANLIGPFLRAHEYPWYPKREAIIELMGLLVSLLVKRAKHIPKLTFTYWEQEGRNPHFWWVDREKFLLWWPALQEANQNTLQLPKQEHFLPIPPITFQPHEG